MNIPPRFWDNSYCETRSVMRCGIRKQGFFRAIGKSGQTNCIRRNKTMAKNYESESKNSRNYTGTSDKNSYGNEMNHAGNAKISVKSKNETDCRSKAKNKTSQSYSSEEDRY